MSTMSRGSGDSPERTAQVKYHFQDGQYVLTSFRLEQDDADCSSLYVFLYDAGQRSLFLGQETQSVDLWTFWQRHREDADYCIACELMLRFDERWIAVPGEPPVELGIGTGAAKRLLEAIKSAIPPLQHADMRDL